MRVLKDGILPTDTETRTHIRIEEKQLKQDMCMTSMCFRFTLSDVPCRAVIDGLVDSILLSLYTYFTYLPHSFRLYILTTPPSPERTAFSTPSMGALTPERKWNSLIQSRYV